MAVRWIALLLTVGLFAGCVEEPATSQSVTSPTTSSAPAVSQPANTTAPAPNVAPTASLTASNLTGAAPANITFSLEGSDADGDALNWTLDVDNDGNAESNGTELPANVNHTFDAEGNFTVILTVTDGTDSATANLTLNITAPVNVSAGLPVPDGSVSGSVFAYQDVGGAGAGASNVVALVTGAAMGDPVPKYPAGSDVQISARSVTATGIEIDPDTPSVFTLYNLDGTIAMGPIEGTGAPDSGAVSYTVGTQTLPSEAGQYLMDFALTVDGVVYHVKDDSTDSGGLKMIEII